MLLKSNVSSDVIAIPILPILTNLCSLGVYKRAVLRTAKYLFVSRPDHFMDMLRCIFILLFAWFYLRNPSRIRGHFPRPPDDDNILHGSIACPNSDIIAKSYRSFMYLLRSPSLIYVRINLFRNNH